MLMGCMFTESMHRSRNDIWVPLSAFFFFNFCSCSTSCSSSSSTPSSSSSSSLLLASSPFYLLLLLFSFLHCGPHLHDLLQLGGITLTLKKIYSSSSS